MTHNNAYNLTGQLHPTNIPLSGDIKGRNTSSTVTALQGHAIKKNDVPVDGYEFTWINANSEWEASDAILEAPLVNITFISAGTSYTVLERDMLIMISSSTSATTTINLTAPTTGRFLWICKPIGGGADAIEVRVNGTLICTALSRTVCYYDGTNWVVPASGDIGWSSFI